jgi:hypothetical protein
MSIQTEAIYGKEVMAAAEQLLTAKKNAARGKGSFSIKRMI